MTDDYERQYMPGEGAVLYRDKATIPRWALGLVGGLPPTIGAVVSGVLLATGIAVLPALAPVLGTVALAGIAAGCMVLFASARLVVSEGAMELKIGMSGPRIPIDDIEAVDVTRSATRARGLGVRVQSNGKVYNMMGHPDRAVRLKLRSSDRPIFVVNRDPTALADAIRAAMARRGAVHARVAADQTAAAEAEVPAAADAAGRSRARR